MKYDTSTPRLASGERSRAEVSRLAGGEPRGSTRPARSEVSTGKGRTARQDPPVDVKKDWFAYGIYALVALAVMLPLLKPGFILTLDMIFTPELRLPENLTSSYPFHAFLHLINLAIPADIIQKILLLSIVPLASIGLHRLIRLLHPTPTETDWGIYIASIFFAINPFTYSRFMAGQYAVLLGYALLPWFAYLLLRFIHRPTAGAGLKLGGLATLIGIVSIHTLAGVGIMSLVAFGIILWRYRHKLGAYLRFGSIALGLFIILSGYWLVPLAFGQSQTADIIGSFTVADSEAFATRGSNALVQLGNVLRLQGFWAEDKALFLLPQDRAVLWGTMALAILALVVLGAAALWRKNRPLTLFFAASGILALVLAIGLPGSWDDQLLLLAGLREPHKLVGLVALMYGVFLAFGINACLGWIRDKAEIGYSIVAVFLLLLPFIFMRVMFWGFSGQLTPRHYPTDWSWVNQQLNQDEHQFNVLFLPWHQYMSFDFAGRIIASPAPQFFDKPTIASTDPELEGATSGKLDERQTALAEALVGAAKGHDISRTLTAQNIKYVILAKDLDYQDYAYIEQMPDFKRIADYPTISLYENITWRTP
jgi:hypothetical protein